MKAMTWTAMLVAGLAVTATATDQVPLTPEKLWAKHCTACHAKDGTGNPKMLKTLKVELAALSLLDDPTKAKTDAELTTAIADGIPKTKMLSFKKKFTAEQTTSLVVYLRTLQAPVKK